MNANTSLHNKLSERAMFVMAAERRRQREESERLRPIIQAEGLEALDRLLPIAQGTSGQCLRVAFFLLGLYNGIRFPFDLTKLRGLDLALFNDCLAVLRRGPVP